MNSFGGRIIPLRDQTVQKLFWSLSQTVRRSPTRTAKRPGIASPIGAILRFRPPEVNHMASGCSSRKLESPTVWLCVAYLVSPIRRKKGEPMKILGKGFLICLVVALSSEIGLAQSGTCSGMSLGQGANLNGFVPFPSTSLWNSDISAAPVDPNSANIINFIGATVTLHPDFGAGTF